MAKTMTAAAQQKRREKFMPGGVPKHIRCYDNGGLDAPDGTSDRYIVVFTKANCFLGGRRRSPHLCMSGAPFNPQGICMHGEAAQPIDRPTYGHLGKKIEFTALPADCRKVVIRDYEDYWGFSGRSQEEW